MNIKNIKQTIKIIQSVLMQEPNLFNDKQFADKVNLDNKTDPLFIANRLIQILKAAPKTQIALFKNTVGESKSMGHVQFDDLLSHIPYVKLMENESFLREVDNTYRKHILQYMFKVFNELDIHVLSGGMEYNKFDNKKDNDYYITGITYDFHSGKDWGHSEKPIYKINLKVIYRKPNFKGLNDTIDKLNKQSTKTTVVIGIYIYK